MTGIRDREKALIGLQKQTSGFLCSTLGHEGGMALVNGEILYVKGFKIKAVDTTGAGDCLPCQIYLRSFTELGIGRNLKLCQYGRGS
jgi:sugar/nucleoside kinase (ribokinase family)